VLTNSPLFLVGKGPIDSPNSWNGRIDDVRVFGRALAPGEIEGISADNYGAVVDPGSNVTVQLNIPLALTGKVTDDGRPVPPASVSNTWVFVSGPTTVTIPTPHNLTNTVVFTQAGDYVFRLIGDDGEVKVFNDITVTAIEPTQVYVFASDPDAAELGPDPGEFTFQRVGDLNVELQVFFTVSGTASNSADFISISNSITFPSGIDLVTTALTPFLDDRIEGDETAVLTIVTNLAYTIGNGTASVTIHDSPYGQWSVQHFTLEELTLPQLSGAGADFDHDGYVNFAEYAFNLDPRIFDTNAPMQVTIETTNSARYLMLTFHRRLQPTDTAYQPAVSVADDLRSWLSGTNYVEELSATDDGNGITETVKARVIAPFPSLSKQFVTVRVWLMVTGP
jgi:hypothetical protein